MNYAGIEDYCASVFASEDAVAVRIRVGRNGREVTTIQNGTVQVEDYDKPSKLSRELSKRARKAQLGDKRPSWAMEALDDGGKVVKGLVLRGRLDKSTPPAPAPSVSPGGPLTIEAVLALVNAGTASLTSALVQTVESMRLVMESQAETISEMGQHQWDTAEAMANLKAQLAAATVTAELGGGGEGLGAEEEAGLDLMKTFVEQFAGKGGKLTKSALMKAIDDNPEKAMELMGDPEVLAKLRGVVKAKGNPG